MNSYLWTRERKEGFSQRFHAGIAKAKNDYAAENTGLPQQHP
jgi:limonene 1,2-monooxygenase